jgi:hypothetical protein
MRIQNSAIERAWEAVPASGFAQSLLHTCIRLRIRVRKFRADQLFLQELLLENSRPWEREGPASWRQELGGWRLVGSALPDEARHDRDPAGPS